MADVKMTVKQKRFCDEYLICGNAAEAARRAGYSEKTAGAIGIENLTKPAIKDYIQERQRQIESEKIADITEVMQYYTAVMRGEAKDQFDLDVSVADRLSAARELMKRFERAEGQKDDNTGITIINNIPRPEES